MKAEFVDFGGQNKNADDEAGDNQMIESSIRPEEWMMEVERVGLKLKMPAHSSDPKEWRSHLDQTKVYANQVKKELPPVKQKLEKLSEEVSKALEKIAKKESMLNKSLAGQTGDYKGKADKLKDISNQYNSLDNSVHELERQLQEINDRLTDVQGKTDNIGKGFSDTSPLQKIKKAIAQIKSDIKNVDIRIGVVTNTLMQCKLKKERSKDGDVTEKGGLNLLENDYDMEL